VFEEEIIKTKDKLIIKIRATKIRKYFHEKKEVYRKNVHLLIPDEFKNKLKLISQPDKNIANFKSDNTTLNAEWVYEIVPIKSTTASQSAATTRQKKTRTRTKTTRTRTVKRKTENANSSEKK
jgi:hypothetical protein